MADFDPATIEISKRLLAKFELEAEKFDVERYAFDNFDDEAIESVTNIIKLTKNTLEAQFKSISLEENPSTQQNLTPQEQDALIRLKKIEILVSGSEKDMLFT